jgi:peptidoglycan-associated lipoprotein
MNRHVRLVCVLTLGCATLWSVGCANKTVRSGGDTATAGQADASRSYPDGTAAAPGFSGVDPSGTERLSPGIATAKTDPSAARRQRDEIRAEEAATAAAGLRDVFFAYDSWTINEEGRQALSRDAEWLRMHPAVHLKVEGHCDERGSSSYNFVLAEKRAKSVRNYLVDLGIRPERVAVVSYGKERPFCKDRSEACYQQNRRGHLVVKP